MKREEREEFEKELKGELTEGMKKAHREEFGIDGAFDSNNDIFKAQNDNLKRIETKPKQYQIGIDTFQRAKANMTKEQYIACMKFNIDKYNWRDKGQDIEDFKKIIDYAIEAISVLEGN